MVWIDNEGDDTAVYARGLLEIAVKLGGVEIITWNVGRLAQHPNPPRGTPCAVFVF